MRYVKGIVEIEVLEKKGVGKERERGRRKEIGHSGSRNIAMSSTPKWRY